MNRNGLRWRDAPREYGPAKTLHDRWQRCGDMGVFARMREGLAVEAATLRPMPKGLPLCRRPRRNRPVLALTINEMP